MPCPSVVRYARPEDKQEVWRLFLQAHNENGAFSLAADRVDWFINRAVKPQLIPQWDMGPRGVIGVIGDVGRLEGLVFVCIGNFWYSDQKHLEEYIVYVDPECRRSRHAQSLIRWMKQQSDRLDVPLLTGVISNERTHAKCELYGRMLPKAGEFYLYKPTAASSAAAVA
jgi:hypothetical protein